MYIMLYYIDHICDSTCNIKSFKKEFNVRSKRDNKIQILTTYDYLVLMETSRDIYGELFNMVKPNRTEPNRNRQYGLVLVYTI